jgi:sugar/nucleoside kinase (ribokinase family)
MAPERRGITCAGNWIVDRVKLIDAYPAEERLADISGEHRSGGGGAHNVCLDLARLEAPFPLRASGIVGDDEDGRWLIKQAYQRAVDIQGLHQTKSAPTSYTDVMTVRSTGRRTFFHLRGANNLYGPDDVDPGASRILHLAYLLLLDGIDPHAAPLLRRLRAEGVKTSVDVVSAPAEKLRSVVLPALEHIDILFMNDLEAGDAAGRTVRRADGSLDRDALREAARFLRRDNLVVVHMPEGALSVSKEGELWSPSRPVAKVVSAVGAGDAFAAGVLCGLHEGWPVAASIDLGHRAAAACLGHETTTGGLRPLSELQEQT